MIWRSHIMKDEVIKDVISTLSEWYGKEAPVVVTRGKLHDYLRMMLDFSVKGKVKVIMKDYIQDMLDELPIDMDGESATRSVSQWQPVDLVKWG